MRFTGRKSIRLTHSFIFSVALIFTVYFVECESRARLKRDESDEADEDKEQDFSSNRKKTPGVDEKWSMDPVKADDYSNDLQFDAGFDIPLIGLDIQEASILRSLPHFLRKFSGMEVSGFSANVLCNQLDDFMNLKIKTTEKPKLYAINIPLENPSKQAPPTLRDTDCITWTSKACVGQRLASAFDPQCIFWIPVPSSNYGCDYDYSTNVDTLLGNGIRLNGYDAFALCQSVSNIVADGSTFEIPLKTNEASQLRCVEFIQQSESEWTRKEVSYGCDEVNKFRISSLVSNFQIEPYIGRMGCVGIGKDIECNSETPISTTDN